MLYSVNSPQWEYITTATLAEKKEDSKYRYEIIIEEKVEKEEALARRKERGEKR